MSIVVTEIVNETRQPLKVQVGNSLHASDLATVEAGAKYVLKVDFNATYQEHVMGVMGGEGNKLVVSSDDLCDHKSMTINEEDGKLNVHKEPRHQTSTSTNKMDTEIDTTDDGSVVPDSTKWKWMPAWLYRLGQEISTSCHNAHGSPKGPSGE